MVRIYAALVLTIALALPLAARPAPSPVRDEISTQLNCDSLLIEQPLDKATMHDLIPAHSLQAAESVLTRHSVKFERHRGTMMLTSITAKMKRDIDALPQGEPIILPDGEGHAICVLLPSQDSI